MQTLQDEYLRGRAARDERAHEADLHEQRSAVGSRQWGSGC